MWNLCPRIHALSLRRLRAQQLSRACVAPFALQARVEKLLGGLAPGKRAQRTVTNAGAGTVGGIGSTHVRRSEGVPFLVQGPIGSRTQEPDGRSAPIEGASPESFAAGRAPSAWGGAAVALTRGRQRVAVAAEKGGSEVPHLGLMEYTVRHAPDARYHRRGGRRSMNTVRKICESDERGTAHVDVPVGLPGRRVEVVIVWQDVDSSDTPEARGWPHGWVESTAGAIDDPSFVRHPQGEYEEREGLQ
jgi:hypothetical protein